MFFSKTLISIIAMKAKTIITLIQTKQKTLLQGHGIWTVNLRILQRNACQGAPKLTTIKII